MLLELMKTRRSIRKYKDKPIEKEKVDTILKSALLAPSSRAIRPWQFVAVTDAELRKQLSLCREHGPRFAVDAPLVIAVLAVHETSDVWVEDASIASTYILLAAHSLDLGACWIQVRNRVYNDETSAGEYIKQVLDIPEQFSVECLIAIGYSDEEKEGYSEDALLYDKVHYDKY